MTKHYIGKEWSIVLVEGNRSLVQVVSSLDLANSSKISSKIIASFRLKTEEFLSSMWKANLGKQVTTSAVVAILVFGITKQLCL
ncbi:hypothetical protein Goklo_011093 [Gossypium klotzschianum]|uniref:Uncharacterized protein n=1 Tax=Gossypium klotzschianum TaxID=34286 RepID=A0A7J8V7Z5_9ROSI|nr:hypothetical protein [Gossypium klotzschianum]